MSSKLRADKAIMKDLHVIVSHLGNVAAGEGGYRSKTEKAIKAARYLKEVTSVSFLSRLHLFIDVLEQITSLSKV